MAKDYVRFDQYEDVLVSLEDRWVLRRHHAA
jgi:hypothetical protein